MKTKALTDELGSWLEGIQAMEPLCTIFLFTHM